MAERLSDDEIRDRIMAMWSLTVDERGNRHTAQTEMGQHALNMLVKILGAAIVLDLKKGEVVSLDDHRRPKV